MRLAIDQSHYIRPIQPIFRICLVGQPPSQGLDQAVHVVNIGTSIVIRDGVGADEHDELALRIHAQRVQFRRVQGGYNTGQGAEVEVADPDCDACSGEQQWQILLPDLLGY